jgi:hypothetical protein
MDEAKKLEDDIINRKREQLETELKIAEAEAARNKTSTEALDEINRLEVELIQLKSEQAKANRAFNKQRNGAEKEYKDEQKQAHEEWKKQQEEKANYFKGIIKKIEELQADSDKKILENKIKNLEEEKNAALKKYELEFKEGQKLTEKQQKERQAVLQYYKLEEEKLINEYNKKQLEIAKTANNELLAITNKLNEERIKNSNISNEQMTAALISNANERYTAELKALEEAKEKELEKYGTYADLEKEILELQKKSELETLTESEAAKLALLDNTKSAYIATVDKWNAKITEKEFQNKDAIEKIEKDGFNKHLELLNQQAKDEENRRFIEQEGIVTKQEHHEAKMALLQEEFEAWEKRKEDMKGNAEIEAESDSAMLELKRQMLEEKLAMDEEERQSRLAVLQATTDALFTVSDAMASTIEDEKKRVVVEQGLAMAKVLLNQGIAIAGATASGSALPFPANIVAIVAGVATVAAQIVASISAIKKAKSATAYAEGTDYHRGGAAIVGEKKVNGQWQPEVVQTPDNKMFMIKEPTYFEKLPIGTSVTPLPEFDTNGYNTRDFSYYEQWERNNKLLEQLLSKPTVNIDVSDKITSYIETKMSKTKILNARFKM